MARRRLDSRFSAASFPQRSVLKNPPLPPRGRFSGIPSCAGAGSQTVFALPGHAAAIPLSVTAFVHIGTPRITLVPLNHNGLIRLKMSSDRQLELPKRSHRYNKAFKGICSPAYCVALPAANHPIWAIAPASRSPRGSRSQGCAACSRSAIGRAAAAAYREPHLPRRFPPWRKPAPARPP